MSHTYSIRCTKWRIVNGVISLPLSLSRKIKINVQTHFIIITIIIRSCCASSFFSLLFNMHMLFGSSTRNRFLLPVSRVRSHIFRHWYSAQCTSSEYNYVSLLECRTFSAHIHCHGSSCNNVDREERKKINYVEHSSWWSDTTAWMHTITNDMQHTKSSQICTSNTFRSPPMQLPSWIICTLKRKWMDGKFGGGHSLREYRKNDYEIHIKYSWAIFVVRAYTVRQPDSSHFLNVHARSEFVI